VPRPPAAAPLRYRDAVFTDVTVTTDHQYGGAPDRSGVKGTLLLDRYRPTGDPVTAGRPAVI
jgi:hypothetical protein